MSTKQELSSYQQRVVDERSQLEDKIEKLGAFMRSPIFSNLSADEQRLMSEQYEVMTRYGLVLTKRLARWRAILPFDSKAADFEVALVALTQAVDGQGQRVLLYRGQNTARALREATCEFMEPFDRIDQTVFLNGLDPASPSEPAEAAAWRNLALLANATAAAIDAGV